MCAHAARQGPRKRLVAKSEEAVKRVLSEKLRSAGIRYRLDRLGTGESRGDVVRDFRGTVGISSQDFAAWLGVSPVSLSRWENGTIPDGPLCVLLAGVCRLGSVDYRERIGSVPGAVVRTVRRSMRATPKELAALLRVTPVTVSRWETADAIAGPAAVLFTLIRRDRRFWFDRLGDPSPTQLADVLDYAVNSA